MPTQATNNSVFTLNNYYKLHYLKIPVMLRYNIAKFYTEFGPELQFMISNKTTSQHFLHDFEIKCKLKNPNTTQFALALGAGYKINQNLQAGFYV